jgi:Vault protein inter-alpha-trypsin domain
VFKNTMASFALEALSLKDKDSGESVPLVSAKCTVRVRGAFLAETEIELVFRNFDEEQDKEGELVFPLNEGAKVCAYAVDVKGAMVDAVLVEKEVARATFEAEVREKKAGPALLEQVTTSRNPSFSFSSILSSSLLLFLSYLFSLFSFHFLSSPLISPSLSP